MAKLSKKERYRISEEFKDIYDYERGVEERMENSIIPDTCLSILKISERVIGELNEQIIIINRDNRLDKIAKKILIKEAENGIKRFESIKNKVNEYCLFCDEIQDKINR